LLRPRLTFFCELNKDDLQELFADPSVLKDLKALEASVSLGILDLSPERAAIIKKLNKAGVPVIGWQLLPEEQGYWFNLDNHNEAADRYDEFQRWTEEHKLRWAGIGIDIEPDIREVDQLLTSPRQLLPTVVRRAFDRKRLNEAQAAYTDLVERMHSDGYRVVSYHIPLIVDERTAGSKLLQRVAGLVDIPVDREVLMLYTSFLRPRGPGILWSYAQEAQSVGVGSTGGGVEAGGLAEIDPLSWDELARDLALAHQWVDDIQIFSLEGCVRQGFMPQLKEFDWMQSIDPPIEMAAQVDRIRRMSRAILWSTARPYTILIGVVGLGWLISRLRSRRN
jgi:hypothetical protein